MVVTETRLVAAAGHWVGQYPYNSRHLTQSLVWLDRLAPNSREAVRLATLTHDMERAFPPVAEQVGLLAFVGALPVGLDVVGGRALYARLHARLLRGYLLDALDRATSSDAEPSVPEEPAAQRYLDAVRAARRATSPTPGKGTYAVLTGDVVGGELIDGERVAHLSAFPAEWDHGVGPHEVRDREPPIPGPRYRRRGPPPII